MRSVRNRATQSLPHTALLAMVLMLVGSWACLSESATPPAQDPSPTPTVTFTVIDESQLPDGCKERATLTLVQALLDTINRGDTERLAQLIPSTQSSFSRAVQGDLGLIAYGVSSEHLGDFGGVTSDQVVQWITERHRVDERQQLMTLSVHRSLYPGAVNIEFSVARQARDHPYSIYTGKGSIDCEQHRVFLWNMTDQA